jgi:ATP-dependent helicase HrpA
MKKNIAKIKESIANSLCKDRFLFEKRLGKLSKYKDRNKIISSSELDELLKDINSSIEHCNRRLSLVPKLEFPDLPISKKREEIGKVISENQVTIICGETGSGKTTQLPKICLGLGQGAAGLIGHTQPRRLAAIRVAERIAEEVGQSIGETVAYKIRFQAIEQRDSLIKLMTDGILLAEIKSDPYLSHYDTLILDEAHERSLNIDFLLGYLKWLLPRRRDLKLVITSATIDPDCFSRHFDNAPVINVSGRSYPVETRYRPVEGELGDETARDLQQAIIDAAAELHSERAGDILVFLSGEREIRETAESLRKHHPADCEILPLYSRLSAKEQANVFRSHSKTRIVLATNVAETSLTVPGIRCVIDTGVARISRYSHRSKIQKLPIEKISQASANQRSGRCGRVAAGICVRLYSEEDFNLRPEFTEPEVHRTNLASVILQMKLLNLTDITRFPFVEPPEDKMIRGGVKTLQELGALDAAQVLTQIGRQLVKFPLDPQLGRMILSAKGQGSLAEVLVIVSALSIQDPRERPLEFAQAADEKQKRFLDEKSDFISFLNLWNCFQKEKQHLSNSKLRRFCRDHFISYLRMREWQEIHQQLMKVVKGELGFKLNSTTADYEAIHRALLSGLITRIGYKSDQSEYLGARNTKFFIHPGSALFKVKPKWIMVSEQVETTRVYGRNVAAIQPEWIESAASHLLKRQHYEPHWSKRAGQAMVYERSILFGLTVNKGRKVPLYKMDLAAAREIFIRSALVERDFDCREEFFKHNQSLLETADYEQQKGRRADLVVDDEWLFKFYDERIPTSIYGVIAFNKWLKERKNQKGLRLSLEEITASQDAAIDEDNFPDHFSCGDASVALEYRFEPGHIDDGVTALIPLAQLNQLTNEPFEWLVPGLIREKIISLLKGLPKVIRRNFVPVPDYVDHCLPELSLWNGPLYQALENKLKKYSGVTVKTNDWHLEKLPLHLKMNFRLLDGNGKIIKTCRDLGVLQAEFGVVAREKFHSTLELGEQKSGLSDWGFGDIPKQKNLQSSTHEILAYPALIDEQESVGLQLLDSKSKAKAVHRLGVIRLFHLKLKRELKQLVRNLSINAKDELIYSRLPKHPYQKLQESTGLYDDLQHCLIASLFLDNEIRSGSEFEQSLESNRCNLNSRGYEIAELLSIILSDYKSVLEGLSGWKNQKPTGNDILQQLGALLYPGFLRQVPLKQLKHYPRYLKAILIRLDKVAGNIQRDQQNYEVIEKYQSLFWQSMEGEDSNPEEDSFRWQLEELRVSLFSQPLKTAYPISAKRLEKAWNKRSC